MNQLVILLKELGQHVSDYVMGKIMELADQDIKCNSKKSLLQTLELELNVENYLTFKLVLELVLKLNQLLVLKKLLNKWKSMNCLTLNFYNNDSD
jgi:hypothetical protein